MLKLLRVFFAGGDNKQQAKDDKKPANGND
jgi:hypothetical protein